MQDNNKATAKSKSKQMERCKPLQASTLKVRQIYSAKNDAGVRNQAVCWRHAAHAFWLVTCAWLHYVHISLTDKRKHLMLALKFGQNKAPQWAAASWLGCSLFYKTAFWTEYTEYVLEACDPPQKKKKNPSDL